MAVALLGACAQGGARAEAVDPAVFDSLDAGMMEAHRRRDPAAYARLHTDSVVFEWPTLSVVRGRGELEALMRGNWQSRNDLRVEFRVTRRRIGETMAVEAGAYTETWRDPGGAVVAEYGRYASTVLRESDGQWRIDHFFGFADSTVTTPRLPVAPADPARSDPARGGRSSPPR